MVELQDFKRAIKILDTIIAEEDETVETWYLLGFSHCKLKKYTNAKECVDNVKQLIKKQKITNDEFIIATEELVENIKNALGKDHKMESDNDEADGYETYSEEEVSSDEENKMKD